MSCVHPPGTDAERLAAVTARLKVVESGCWVWQGSLSGSGYGRAWFRGRAWPVHKIMYTMHKGEVPDGAVVCHTCDNPPCCNPDHLWFGTQDANVRDAYDKGRRLRIKPRRTHCAHGHSIAEHGKYYGTKYSCGLCSRIRQRIDAGWTPEQAISTPKVPFGLCVGPGGGSRKRKVKIARTHCRNGHAMDEANSYFWPGSPYPRCRQCRNEYLRAYNKKARGELLRGPAP